MPDEREACGRCSMTTAVDVAQAGRETGESEGDGEGKAPARADPFGDARIEVDERDLRRVSPAAWLDGVSTALSNAVDRFTWGDGSR